MKAVQRKFGTFTKRSEDDADVNTILTEFKAVDDMLERLVKDLKACRDSWDDILKLQYDTSEAFANLYKPVDALGPDAEPPRQPPAVTPANNMQKCLGLQKEYSDEKADLAQELTLMQSKLLRPTEEAKQSTKMLHKTLKHRENTKLDYERYLSRAEHARKKDIRTLKEETALQQHETNLAQSRIDYQTADEQVRQTFPPVTAAVLGLVPYLLAQQVRFQTTLVGQLYTVLDGYTKRFGFPNPSPSDTEIVRAWDNDFTSFRKEVEGGIPLIAQGRAVQRNMSLPPEKDKSTYTGLGIRNKVMARKDAKPTAGMPGRPVGGTSPNSSVLAIEAPGEEAPRKPPRPGTIGIPSPGQAPGFNLASKPKLSPNNTSIYEQQHASPPPPYPTTPGTLTPGYLPQPAAPLSGTTTPSSQYQTPHDLSPRPTGNNAPDYFSTATKKKPPPPVPTKRLPSHSSPQFVTALFDFAGQSAGDLSFREGDRIRVVRKTEMTEDWWEGELGGVRGSFPANYVQL